jgi:hypothetical protein
MLRESGVDLEVGDDVAAFVVVAVGELVARRDALHADFGEEVLVVVGARAAHEEHGRLAVGARAHVGGHGFHLGHLLGDDLFHAVDERAVAEVLGDLTQRLGRGGRADEVHLDPRDAVLGLQHVGHVVDGPVAHDGVEVGLVGRGELVVGRVAREGGVVGDAALLEDAVDLEAVAADVVLAEQVDAVLAGLVGIVLAHHVAEYIWLLAMWCPADWDTPLYPSQEKAKTLQSPNLAFIFRATAWMSSPMSPRGRWRRWRWPWGGRFRRPPGWPLRASFPRRR